MKKNFCIITMLAILPVGAGAANYYTCSACAVPGACQAGAISDCTYNNKLSLEEATRCIGVPAKTRWVKVAQGGFSGNYGAIGTFSPGVYRFDSSRDECNSGDICVSFVAVFDKDWSYRMNDGYVLQIDADNAAYAKESFATAGKAMNTPGITVQDMEMKSGYGWVATIYKLD
ncbi:MAG: hypothetical protein LBL52_00195 [Rickettsiales bacterium]|jgi:hypothetical protein|nr:hypothetical protein [Rickettsiales bacterium]